MVPVKANRQHELLSPLDGFSAYQQDYLDIYSTPENAWNGSEETQSSSLQGSTQTVLPQFFYGTLQISITNGNRFKITFSSINSPPCPTRLILTGFEETDPPQQKTFLSRRNPLKQE